jgi:hypothetical protein
MPAPQRKESVCQKNFTADGDISRIRVNISTTILSEGRDRSIQEVIGNP